MYFAPKTFSSTARHMKENQEGGNLFAGDNFLPYLLSNINTVKLPSTGQHWDQKI
jgi:hypothetical protein